MADPEKSDAGDSAEKAYAAAAEAVAPKPVAEPVPVEFPSKAKRGSKAASVKAPTPIAPVPVPAPETASIEAVEAKAATPLKPAKLAPARKPAVVKAKPVAKAPVVKPVPSKAIKPMPAPRKLAAPAITKPKTAPTQPADSQIKETPMNAQTNDFTTSATDKLSGLKTVFADVKTKAKAAFDKGTASIGEATDFAKGNVEAVVESGKIYAAGLQELGSSYVAESKSAFEAFTADAKELAAQKTPTDFFKLQGELAKKNFDSAVAFGTKSSEAWLKLAGDVFAPISGRVNLAVEKVKAAA